MNFLETCNAVQQSRRDAVAAGDHEAFDADGVSIQLRHYYSDRRHDRRQVFVDGYEFAMELEFVPWNIFKPITTRYWVWLDLPRYKVAELIHAAKLDREKTCPETGKKMVPAAPMEEFYPTESGPRWNASASDLESVVKLWLVWAPKYRPN